MPASECDFFLLDYRSRNNGILAVAYYFVAFGLNNGIAVVTAVIYRVVAVNNDTLQIGATGECVISDISY